MKNILLFTALLCSMNAFAEETKSEIKNEAEAGIVLTSGNTETNTISFKDKTTYFWGQNRLTFNPFFLKSSNFGVEQAYNWNLGLRYERDLSEHFGVFLGQLVQSDKYQGINQRYATDIGGKYSFEKTDQLNWFVELGYRFTRENYTTGDAKNLNFLRLYHDIQKSWTKNYSVRWWVEYLPNITRWKGYQLNTEASISAVLTDIFSLKSAYLIRFYNEPPAGIAHTTDTTFTTALVAKF